MQCFRHDLLHICDPRFVLVTFCYINIFIIFVSAENAIIYFVMVFHYFLKKSFVLYSVLVFCPIFISFCNGFPQCMSRNKTSWQEAWLLSLLKTWKFIRIFNKKCKKEPPSLNSNPSIPCRRAIKTDADSQRKRQPNPSVPWGWKSAQSVMWTANGSKTFVL
jgi:hypothetical protein